MVKVNNFEIKLSSDGVKLYKENTMIREFKDGIDIITLENSLYILLKNGEIIGEKLHR